MIPFNYTFAVLQLFGLEGWQLIAAGGLALVAGVVALYFVAFIVAAMIFGKSWRDITKRMDRF